MIPMSCSACTTHKELRKRWGCDVPTQRVGQDQKIPDDEGNVYEYNSCPMHYHTPSMQYFLSKYYSIKNGNSLPVEYDEQDAKHVEATQYYEHWFNFCMSKKDNN